MRYNDEMSNHAEEHPNTPTLYLIVPCFNEEDIIRTSASVLSEKTSALIRDGHVSASSRIVFVDDGSTDGTPAILHEIYTTSDHITVLYLSKNFGHQSAVLAGYTFARKKCDVVISIDADLQQETDAIDRFLSKYHAGDEIVFGVRSDRNTDGFFKKASAGLFYSLMNSMGCNIIRNHADYRLMSSTALDALAEYPETNVFLRGLVTDLGFQTSEESFEVSERAAGSSKYSLRKMLHLATDGITSFSVKPVHLLFWLGLIIVLAAIVNIVYTIVVWLSGDAVSGWATIVISIWFLGGLQLIGLGIIGEYIGKTYYESKRRPRYLIKRIEHEPSV